MTDKKFYTTKELAERWGVSVSKINRMRSDGDIQPDFITGRTVRFSLKVIEAFERSLGVNYETC